MPLIRKFILTLLVALLMAGCGGGSGTSNTGGTSVTVTVPAVPIGVVATTNSASQITVNWTNVSSATSYNIYRATTSNVQAIAANKITSVNAQPTAGSFSDSGLTASTAYYYKISAVNSAGESAGSAEVTATTSAAGAPTPTPTVTGFSPSSGAVGTVVTITGINLGLGFQPAPIVKIGTTTVTTPITFNGQTSISFTVPSGLAAAAYPITIGGATGTPISVGTFTVTAVTSGASSGGVGGGNIGGGAGRTMGGIATPALPATLPTVNRLTGTNPSGSIVAAWTAAKPALKASLTGFPAGSVATESVDYVAQTYSKFGTVLDGNVIRVLNVLGGLGLDGLPNTADDVVTHFIRGFYPPNSKVSSGVVTFNSAGADGVWLTADDLATATTDFMNAVIGADGLGHQFLVPRLMAGTDRVFFTADDTLSSPGYDFISLNANGFGVQDVHYASAGADATFFTADDVVSWYTVFNVDVSGNALQAITYFGAGVDGIWFTADDVVKTATAAVVSGGRLTHIANFGPGPDTIWFNADDTITGWDYYVYDAAGRVQLLITHASAFLPASAISTLYDAAGHPVQVASHLAIGADNLWMTGDDNLMTNTVKEWDAAGNQIRQVQYNGKGADGLWFTTDDVVTPGFGYWYSTYDANGKQTLRIDYSGAGTDGLPFTADDVVTSYQINRYSATGQLLANISVNNMGADGRAFTADDVGGTTFATSTQNAAGKTIKNVLYSGPGADGIYFTADDPISYYWTYTYDGQGRTLTYAYYNGAGVDGVWQTADDVAASTSTGVYDVAGNSTTIYRDAAGIITTWYKSTVTNAGLTTDSIYYGTAGADGIWQTADDVVSGVTHGENNAAGSLTVYGYGGLGVDGILNTADDYLPGGYTRYVFDIANVLTSFTQYSTAGVDGIWFTADDVKKTGYFYKLTLP